MSSIVRFGPYEIDLSAGQLRKRGVKINLRDQSFRVLVSLLERPGEVVTREELRQHLWHEDVFVDFENNLNTAVARLRGALGDSAEHPHYIETLPKRGYRFVAPIIGGQGLSAPTPLTRARLVVLPFLDLSSDPMQGCSDALTDEIITALAAFAPEQLAVIARTTAMHYKGSHKHVARIGRELHVDYVVEGAVRRTQAHLAITVQLIQTSDQTHLFAGKYEVGLCNIFDVTNGVVEAVVAHIPGMRSRLSAGASKGRSPKKPTEDVAAYNEYIQGRYRMSKGTPEDLTTARQHFERAIERDPEFALGYDALAEFYWYLGYFGLMPPREAFSAGIIHALRALEIDNTRAETHALLGQFHKTIEYNWPEVHREMSVALQLDPNSPLVRMRYAVSELMPHGRLEEAVAELERALELDPLSLMARAWLGINLLLWRHFDRAVEEGRNLLKLDPRYFLAHFVIAVAYRYQNKPEDAIAAQRKAVELSGGAAAMLGWLGLTLAGSGQVAEARAVLERLHGLSAKEYVPPCCFAWLHLGLREIDLAFDWLNRAVEQCDQFMMPIKSYPFLDPIRADPRFTALLRKMNLES